MPLLYSQRDARRIKNDSVANVARAFTNPVRLELLRILCQGEASVTALAEKTGQSPANTSAQLKVLLAANAVEAHRRGRSVFYRIGGESVRQLWKLLHVLAAESSPEFRELRRVHFESVELPLSRRAELLPWARLVDIRPLDEFALSPIPAAVNIPLCNLSPDHPALQHHPVLLIRGRQEFCTEAVEAVRRLREAGRDAWTFA